MLFYRSLFLVMFNDNQRKEEKKNVFFFTFNSIGCAFFFSSHKAISMHVVCVCSGCWGCRVIWIFQFFFSLSLFSNNISVLFSMSTLFFFVKCYLCEIFNVDQHTRILKNELFFLSLFTFTENCTQSEKEREKNA